MEYKRIGWKENIPNKSDTGFWKMALFQTYLLTIPGVPVIYYGDEIGMPGAGDPDNRRMMVFDGYKQPQANLKKKVDELVAMRNNNLALLYGDFQWISNTKYQMIYSRRYFGNYVVVCLNKSVDNYTFEFTVPAGFTSEHVQKWTSKDEITIISKNNKIAVKGKGLTSYVLTYNQK